ncbi:DNA-binding Xre family transcriptional regulator [Ewingella americana]
MSIIQYITDDRGTKVSAVVPIGVFERLLEKADLSEFYEPIDVEAGPNDDETIPHDVIKIAVSKGVTMQAAWRIYRGMTQKEVAERLGIKQSAVSQFEKSENPRSDNLARLASLYECRPAQLVIV